MKRLKYIKGIRVYSNFEKFALSPYDYVYGEIFSALIRNEHIISPHYDEIYISIDNTIEGAKRSTKYEEKWFKYTVSAIKLEEYQIKNEKVKDEMVFKAICDGLRLITKEDNLDGSKIEKIISKIKLCGIETELIHIEKDYANINLKIVYNVLSDHTKKTTFNLRVFDKSSSTESNFLIANMDLSYVALILDKITLKGENILITGRKSWRADLAREYEKLPLEFKFNLSDVVKKF